MEKRAGIANAAGAMSIKAIAIIVAAIVIIAAVAGILLLGGGSSDDGADNWLDKGFKMELYYNAGNDARKTSCEILKTNLESLNPGKIEITVTPLEWSAYLQYREEGRMPAMFLGWAPDYADPDDYVQPFYLSGGTYASMIGYENTTLDRMIGEAAAEIDEETRAQMYLEISQDMYEECVYIWTGQATNFFAGRDTINGYYFNPMYSNLYYYALSKDAQDERVSGYDPDLFVYESIKGNPESFDPAVGYETVGGELFQNIYESLLFYDRESATALKGQLATEVPTVENGGISADGMNYTFNLRPNVKFSNGNDFTAEDVVYSFQRSLALNDPHSATWMIGQVLIPDYYEYGAGGNATGGSGWDWAVPQDVIAEHIWAINDTAVRFNLTQPYPAFNSVLAYNIGNIVDKDYVESIGGISYAGYEAMDKDWHHMMGTGPYKIDDFRSQEVTRLVANPTYWDGEAAIGTVLIKQVSDANTRILHLKSGEADAVFVPRQQKLTVEDAEGIAVVQGKPTFNVEFLGLNQDLKVNSTKTNVPADFFADRNVRLAFAYAFDYTTYINKTLMGTAIQPNGAIPMGMFGYSEDVPMYEYNLDKAKEYLKAAKVDKSTSDEAPLVDFSAVVNRSEA
jgi:ABC-type transport system substrate-binding protein